MADHWTPEPTVRSAKAVGYMEVSRGGECLHIRCSTPPQFVSIYGEKLKRKQGLIFDIYLSAEREEDEEESD